MHVVKLLNILKTDKEVQILAHGGATMNEKLVITGLMVGVTLGVISDILRIKTGVTI